MPQNIRFKSKNRPNKIHLPPSSKTPLERCSLAPTHIRMFAVPNPAFSMLKQQIEMKIFSIHKSSCSRSHTVFSFHTVSHTISLNVVTQGLLCEKKIEKKINFLVRY